ncbi:hypothetical protein JL722_11971 [Aureococcus anophagefferens]|nr:hypothetical protein JL722_11971 [Aureococcus anophagefferens]
MRVAARALSMQTGQRVVVAVGGNALQRRGDRLTIENMLKAAKQMAPAIMAIQAAGNEVVLTHGNGPQGQIGYVLCQAFQSLGVDAAAIVTQTLVDAADPAFSAPSKFVGPVYGFKEAALAKGLDWTVKQDGEYYRRVVASPKPQAILQLDAVTALLDAKYPLVIAAGGGGAPVSRVFGDIVGVEGVVDKDGTASLMARSIGAQGLIILTDGGGIWEKFGKPDGREMRVAAAIEFVMESPEPGAWAIIGDLNDAAELMGGTKGTLIKQDVPEDVVWYDAAPPAAEPEPGRRRKNHVTCSGGSF